MGYGYQGDRPPMPDRMISGPPQAQPRNTLPRQVSEAIKNPAESSVVFFSLQYTKQCDNTRLLAQTSLDAAASGGGGSKVNTEQTWYSRIARFCRKLVITHSSGALGYDEERLGFDYSLFSLFASTAAPAPWVLRFEDVIAAELSATGTCGGGVQYGMRTNPGVAPASHTPDSPFVGFYCTMSGTGYGTWKAFVCADSGGSSQSTTTTITSELPHLLTVDLNGMDGSITWYIDGEQVAQVTGYTGTLTHTSDDGGISLVGTADGSGVHSSVLTIGYYIDLQTNVSVRVLDEAA